MEDNGSKGKYFELAKNTGVLAIGNFSSKILVFFLVPLYTNYLTTSEYGYYDLAYTTIQLLVPILSLNVTDGVLRFLLENKKNIGAINRVSLKYIISSIIAVGVGLVVCYLVKVPHVSDEYILLLLLYYTSYMFNQYMIQFSKGVDKVKDMAVAGVIGTLFMVLSCLIFLPLLNLGLFGFFISNICGQAMPALYLIIKLRPFSYKANISEDYRSFENRYLSYTLPLIMANIGWWINNTSDRYIITWLEGVEVNGLLSVAYKLPSVLNVVYGLFIQAWQISAMKEYGKKIKHRIYTFKRGNVFTGIGTNYFDKSLIETNVC